MFAAFFYLLRQRGLNVSLNEWITLLEGMEKGLHHSTLTGFYHLCRAVVVKSETEFDRFDQVFLEFFKDVPYTHWAAGYIKTAVQQGWISGYLDGSYKPNRTVTLEEAATGVLKLLGYTTSDFSGSYPNAQLALYKSLNLNTRITASQGSSMTRRNMMYLFYNLLNTKTKDGRVYAQTLGYKLNSSDEIDYLSVISDTM